jgi:hypothetical protein
MAPPHTMQLAVRAECRRALRLPELAPPPRAGK